ncbi:DNA methyltransferase [Brevundimonas bullata]|uniref:site-specific DNA-methyltransferase n=1 Tax=Brevundimonas bullata TaxID=13160 RepID=UPI000E0C84A2|nr:DNA methyltransferase [Brevundimonas bullata]WQE37694.1 DNA methyltransferase [Brevundimonas bullata]
MSHLQITYRPISDLRPRAGNPRTHSQKQIDQIARSIQRFGFASPVLIDKDDGVVAGHGRIAAAKQLGLTEVPTVCLADMSETDVRAYVIADNRLAENAGWDRNLLGVEFQYLADLDVDFDLCLTGFELPEIDAILSDIGTEVAKGIPDDAVPASAAGPAVTRPGDVWQIGRHRLICGDALQTETYAQLLGEEKAGMVFADPPYNLPIAGHVSGLGKAQHREFAMASGEMASQEFANFLFRVFTQVTKASTEGSIHFHCMDWRHLPEILQAGTAAYSELKNLCVWTKTNGGMGSLYRSAHELVLVFKYGRAPHVNNVELGRHGRYRTNVWAYAGANSFGAGRDEDLADHPTVKPVAMIMDAIRDCSRRGDIVLDPFAGSGSTLLAAHRTGRRGCGVEIDPLYCDVIIRRLSERAKLQATLEGDGRVFADVAEVRASQQAEEGAA